MSWIISSIIATLGGASYVSFLKLLQGFYDPSTIIAFIMLMTFLYFYIVKDYKNVVKYAEPYAVLAGISFGMVTYFFNKAINMTNNPGVPSSIVRSQVALTYLVSLFLFKQVFSWAKFVPILVIIFGCIVSVIPNLKDFSSANNSWILMTLYAGICTTFNDAFSKLSLNKISNDQFLVYQMLAAMLTTMGIQYFQTKSIMLKKLPKEKQKKNSKFEIFNKHPKIVLATVVGSLIIFREFLGMAMKNSANPSYPRAIFNSQFFLSLILSLFIQKGAGINKYQGIGSAIILSGVLGISLQT